jgi:DNA excision repair protein ERCC-4
MTGPGKGKGLLPFQSTILDEIHDPATSELVIISRGLGLRTLVCKLLQLYDAPGCLVLLINASQDEELGIGEQLGLLGCRNPGLRIVGHEISKKER